MPGTNEIENIAFPSATAWERWLARNHSSSRGIWLLFFKNGSGTASVTHAEALSAALCHGWIDGQIKKHDDKSWLRKFSPRRAGSIWSKRNRELVEQLAAVGQVTPAGLKEVAAAKT